MPIIAPSLLSANFLELQKDCDMLNNSVADWYHLDVMDGRFVPNISFGLPIIEQIRKATSKICDVHVMILEPEKYAEAFKKAGADIYTVHIEACPHLHRNLQQAKQLGMKAGVALNPHTPIQTLTDVIQDIDVVCLMSVNPGFGGQKFMPEVLEKIKELKKIRDQKNIDFDIEIDGGINFDNNKLAIEAGANILVSGTTIFKNNNGDIKKNIDLLKSS
jgi:ribulose-phosphate 3-epimerase